MTFCPDKSATTVIPMKLYLFLSICVKFYDDNYYNTEKYLIQTRSQARSMSCIHTPIQLEC